MRPFLALNLLFGAFLISSANAQAPSKPPASKTSSDATVQKQRETTMAAMQASIDKQKAAVAASVAASIGKQGLSLAPVGSFFILAPLTPPQQNPTNATIADASMPDISCDPLPEDTIAPVVLGAAQREAIDPKLVTAVIQQESGFRPCAISDKGAQGLMQLMPDTSSRLSVKDPFDSKQNIDGGVKYLKELITRYNGNLALVLSAYNAGPDAVDQAGGVPNLPETAEYVKAILAKIGGQQPPNSPEITDPTPPAVPQQ